MGGFMTYGRARSRNGLAWRPDDERWPYPLPNHPDIERKLRWNLLVGDLNRMERDYLDPVYPEPPFATRPAGSDPASECADATGVHVETVRTVLAYVFRESK